MTSPTALHVFAIATGVVFAGIGHLLLSEDNGAQVCVDHAHERLDAVESRLNVVEAHQEDTDNELCVLAGMV